MRVNNWVQMIILLALLVITGRGLNVFAAPAEGEDDLLPVDDLNTPAVPPKPDDEPGKGIEVNFGGPQMFYDARSIGLDRKNNRSLFEGHVVVIGAGTMLTADKVVVDHKNGQMQAEGHVVLLTPKQVFTGDRINFHWVTGDFKLENAVMTAFSPQDVERLSRDLLGFTAAEIDFEQKRQAQLSVVQQKKADFRRTIRQGGADSAPKVDDASVDRYAIMLEQEDMIRQQENPSLARMGQEKRQGYLKRREFWEKARAEALARYGSGGGQEAYFKISGETLDKTDGNDYNAYQASWTPCKCDEGDAPAWGFRADRIHAQVEGYADMEHPVLEIKGVPILYLPFLKVPLKQRRQSGFLMPTVSSGNQNHGNVYTQPVFFALAPNADATLTTDIYQNRGTRLGMEMRYEQRRYSGWTLKLENIRDRTWMDERSNRQILAERAHEPGGDCAIDPAGAACLDKETRYKIPSNTWRHSQEWRGESFLAPRLSFVSSGAIHSDHRYMEDLNLPDTFEEAFGLTPSANAFTTAKGQFHFDGKDYYLGIGSTFGDNSLADERFKGYQEPAYWTATTRTYNLIPRAAIPLYASLSAEQRIIRDYTTPVTDDAVPVPELGGGRWQRAVLDAVAPLTTEGAVTVDYFAQAEGRAIQHDNLGDHSSNIATWRTGFIFKLPIDGIGLLPDLWQPTDWADDGAGKRYLHHFMDWNLIFSTRPSVRRRGAYGETDPLVYFASDQKEYSSNSDDAVRLENSMVPHQMVTLQTDHRWRVYRKGWAVQAAPEAAPFAPSAVPTTYRDRARQELLKSLDQPPVPSDDFLLNTVGTGLWAGNHFDVKRYDEKEPAQWTADISYDAIQEKKRRETIENNQLIEAGLPANNGQTAIVDYKKLPQPWIGPNSQLSMTWADFSLANSIRYNIYTRTSTATSFGLGLPIFWTNQVKFGYSLDKDPQEDRQNPGKFEYVQTRIRTVSLTTGMIPWVTTRASYAKKSVANDSKDSYETRFGWEYLASSGCWGLRFLRSKDFNVLEENATYVLQLSVIFMGQQRGQDVGAPFIREYRQQDKG